ncbi:hypothetical protein [Spiroplasma chrysopicola]|uniref:Uncharacterized protein n=1 Tax=Spiroplasma chrysopicola DF-1 TaxID=1276227 RepID=R4U1A3_9MOLU|nr:hypothetical protein [Spiroplasma chrysopicola]AGM25112.1 hypothetical protein SCHRY_v1c05340 [Spiroplasma chrysopicola DF-1]
MKKNVAMISKTDDIKLAELNKQFALPDQVDEMSKILIKSWKSSQEYQNLMKATDKISGKTTNLSQKYQAEYLKFVNNLLGEKLTIPKTKTAPAKALRKTRKPEKVLPANVTSQVKKVNPTPVSLITNTSSTESNAFMFNQKIKLNAKNKGLSQTQLELLKSRTNGKKKNSSGYFKSLNFLSSDEKSPKNEISSSTFNEASRTNFFNEMLENDSNNSSENKELVLFNERIKLRSKTFGLSKTQVELLKRRDGVKPQYNNARFERTNLKAKQQVENNQEQEQENFNKISVVSQNFNLSPGQLKLIAGRDLSPQQWKEFIGSSQKKRAEPAPRRKRVTTQEILAKQKQISGRAFKNTLGKKRIFDGKVISNYIAESTAIKTVIKSNPDNTKLHDNELLAIKSLVISNEEKLKKDQHQKAMSSLNRNDIKAEPPVMVQENKIIEEEYISIVDPKKRPNLKKLKYGETSNNLRKDQDQNNIKQLAKSSLEKTKKNSKNDNNEEIFLQKELPDYQIDYFNLEKRPDLEKDLTSNIYTYEGYHPKEIREIERQYLKEVNKQEHKQKLIAKNLKKTARHEKHLKNKSVKPKPLPKILIDKYQKEGKKVVNGILIDESTQKK